MIQLLKNNAMNDNNAIIG